MALQETEKIKLMQLLRQGKINTLGEGMSEEEWADSKEKDRFDALDPKTQMAITKIRALLAKEKDMKEVTSSTLERIDGLVNRGLLVRFLDIFTEIYDDLVVNDDLFEVGDVIDYLINQMQGRAEDSNMSPEGFRSFEEEISKKEPIKENIDKSKEFGVFEKGGSIGQNQTNVVPGKGKLVSTFDTKLEADEYAKRRKKSLSPGEKGYYGMGYSVVKMSDSIRKQLKESLLNEGAYTVERGGYGNKELFLVPKKEPIDEGVVWMKRFSGLK